VEESRSGGVKELRRGGVEEGLEAQGRDGEGVDGEAFHRLTV